MADKRLDQTTNASAVAAADNIPFVTAAGVTSYVTGDEMAASGPFSSRYAPTSGDTVWVGAASMALQTGSPSQSNTVRFPNWLFDQSVEEIVGYSVYLPQWWSSYHVDLYWTNESLQSGNVRWQLGYGFNGDGESIDGATNSYGATTNIAAPSYRVLKVSRLTSSPISLVTGEILAGFVYRIANNAGDTLAGDAAVLGVLFTRAS